jgi:hypothetical protein
LVFGGWLVFSPLWQAQLSKNGATRVQFQSGNDFEGVKFLVSARESEVINNLWASSYYHLKLEPADEVDRMPGTDLQIFEVVLKGE